MPKGTPQVPDETLALYEKLIATLPNIERKGATMPYTSVNGHMFSMLDKSGAVFLRLPKGELEAFLQKQDTKLAESYGAVMREYAVVPDSLLRNTEELQPYLRMSYAYVSSLKPKPTTRKKS